MAITSNSKGYLNSIAGRAILAIFIVTSVTFTPLNNNGLTPQSAFAQSNGSGLTYSPGMLLVKFKDGLGLYDQSSIISASGGIIVDEIPQIKVKIIKVARDSLESVETKLRANSLVEYVERDYVMAPLSIISNDPYLGKQWHLDKLGTMKAWQMSMGSSVTIAILDSGVDPSHPDLAAKLLTDGYNFYDNNADWSDVCGHGTAVAGAAAAITNNGAGVAGLAWDSYILPIRITDSGCYASNIAMTKGIVYAADKGARVANISFKLFDGHALADAAKYMYEKGGWVVAAAGNAGVRENLPDNRYIISVSATDRDDRPSLFSSYGSYIDFAAPGSGIYTTLKGGGYGSRSGTSLSSAIVTGTIALVFSYDPSFTPNEAYDLLKSTTVDLGNSGYNEHYGWGRIDPYSALMKMSTEYLDIASDPGTGTSFTNYNSNYTSSPQQNTTEGEVGNNPGTVEGPSNNGTGETSPPPTNDPVSSLSITITNPTDGSTVKGSIQVSANVNVPSSTSVTKVEIYFDGKLAASMSPNGSNTYQYDWNSRSVKDGMHTISSKAYSADGANATDTISVKVANKPR